MKDLEKAAGGSRARAREYKEGGGRRDLESGQPLEREKERPADGAIVPTCTCIGRYTERESERVCV